MSGTTPQQVHDALLATKPEGVVHEPCDLCTDPLENTKEVAQVADDKRVYTEVEHLALMADAVTRETAELSEAKGELETKVSELSQRVDVLEAEKAALETAKAEVEAKFEEFQTEVERAQAVEAAKKDRLEKVKAANEQLPDSYFTDERIQRWAEMTEEAFASLIDDLSAAAVAGPAKETAAFAGGETPTSAEKKVSVGSVLAARRGRKS
jgi:chromosome segregation ATPase